MKLKKKQIMERKIMRNCVFSRLTAITNRFHDAYAFFVINSTTRRRRIDSIAFSPYLQYLLVYYCIEIEIKFEPAIGVIRTDSLLT